MKMYTAEIIMIIMAMSEMLILVHENARMEKETKNSLYLLHLLVICSACMEWCGFALDGAPESLRWLHHLVKAADFSISPFIGYTFIRLLTPNGTWKKVSSVISFSDVALQFIGMFTGWFAAIDENNIYSEGPLYFIYMFICITTVLLITGALYDYGAKYKKRNVRSLYMCTILTLAGIFMQEVTAEAVRTSNLAIAFATMIIFIHYNEYNQLAEDAIRSRLDEEVHEDILTGIYNRHAYEEVLSRYETAPLPGDLVIFSIDVNGLKEANDSEGHKAGDEVLILSARCMSQVFKGYGDCYRIGGDEFAAIIHTDQDTVSRLIESLRKNAASTIRTDGQPISFAIGAACGCERSDYNLRELSTLADRRMYQDKDRYYSMKEHDRRRRR